MEHLAFTKKGSVFAGILSGIESILLKHLDKILKMPSHLPTHIIKRKLRVLEIYLKSEATPHFYPIFCTFEDFCDFIDRKSPCFVFMSFTSCQCPF